MKNPAFEQPFKSARTNSRSLLFRSRRCGRLYRPGSLSGLASSSMDMQTWHVVPRILSMCCTPWRPDPFSAWPGISEKARMISGIRKQQPGLDRFYNELSANPARIDEQTRDHYAALYAR